jgi:hypothetical protein
VIPDPEPGYFVVFQNTEGAIAQSDPDRVDRLAGMDALELKAGVPGILKEEAVGLCAASRTSVGNSR